jgi:hypothetical protein
MIVVVDATTGALRYSLDAGRAVALTSGHARMIRAINPGRHVLVVNVKGKAARTVRLDVTSGHGSALVVSKSGHTVTLRVRSIPPVSPHRSKTGLVILNAGHAQVRVAIDKQRAWRIAPLATRSTPSLGRARHHIQLEVGRATRSAGFTSVAGKTTLLIVGATSKTRVFDYVAVLS